MEFVKVILVSLLSAVSLFIIAKIMGHKQMAQLDFFDYITGVTIGSIAAELATELKTIINRFFNARCPLRLQVPPNKKEKGPHLRGTLLSFWSE